MTTTRPLLRIRPTAGRALFSLAVATVLLAGCPKYAPMRIHTEANPRVDLGLYRTYSWSAPRPVQRGEGMPDAWGDAPSQPTRPAGADGWAAERTDAQIRGLADAELARRGYVRDTRPQMRFSWYISTRHRELKDTWGDYARYRAEGGTQGAGEAWVDGYEEGSLVIEARDGRNGALLWYGTATAVVNPELRDERIPEAVKEIFSQWPATAPGAVP